MDFKDGAILHGDCLSFRNDGGECGGMPHHRVPLGIELAGRGMDVAICQTAAHHGILRRIHYLLYLYERGSRTDERRELPLYDALSLRKSGAGTYRRSRRTLSGENDCMRRSRRIEEKRLRLPKNILKIVFHQMKK